MLNVGCGRRYHPDWVNVDLVPIDDAVIAYDVSKGLPFENNQFDAVYHSHVLEHLDPDRGRALISECQRVLRPGGIIRVVVPDLEQIARLYLQTHEDAWSERGPAVDYQWMKLELLDQLVRQRSGGQMGRYIAGGDAANMDFVADRLGHEIVLCDPKPQLHAAADEPWWQRSKKTIALFRHRMARRFVRWMLGPDAVEAFDEGMFRRQGEIHRWMYDRFSLRELFLEAGFESFEVCGAQTSRIKNFLSFELDSFGGEVRKPDSIFVEAVKRKTNEAVVRNAA